MVLLDDVRQRVVSYLARQASKDISSIVFGPLIWKEWLAFQKVRDRDHIGQIEAIQRSLSYPKASS